jgi:large subunit ribosomal protein L23
MTEKKAKAKKDKSAAVAIAPRHYDVIDRPVITEKATMASDQDKVTFRVSISATKKDIKEAVEALFKVKVKKVSTITTMGKNKIFKGRAGVRSDVKKAIVTLEKGQKIDIASGAVA